MIPASDAVAAKAPHAPRSAPKLLGLEALRFLSALAVLFWHYQHFWYVGPDPVGFARADQPLYPAFQLFYEWGVYGVQVFWLISGFIFFWKYRDDIHDRTTSAWRFFVLRFSRLYPLHLLTFLLVALLQARYHALTGLYHVYQANDGYHAALQLLMASNWGAQAGDSFNGPIWSVSLEVLAYLFFFVFAMRAGRKTWPVMLVVVLVAIAYQAKLGHVFQCIFCFFVGGLLVEPGRAPFLQRHRALIAGASFVYIAATAVVARHWHLFDRKPVVHLYIVTAAALLIHVLSQFEWPAGRSARWVEAAGNTTYASYLLHFPLQMALMLYAVGSGWRIPREDPAFLVAYLALSIGIGAVAFRAFEMPAQGWLRRRMLGRR